ncbi:MAG: response regulator [Candidatus Dormibacteraeota bacterium]|nr:response regulator [Candidatus Dormibacteraeota bacterium]
MEPSPVLIVEDDDLVRSFLSRALTGVAGDVHACATGAETLREVNRHRFGAILLDGLLPDVHGLDLAKKLVAHRNAASSGICFVSGSLRHPLAMRDGVSALPKPLRLRELLEAVGLLLAWSSGKGASASARLAALNALAADLLVS